LDGSSRLSWSHYRTLTKVETIAEFVKRTRGMAVGVVTTTEIEDATPAGMVAGD